jgi:lysozyme family protein
MDNNMDTTFQYAMSTIIELEGGYVEHPSDPGGATKYGISQRSYPHLDIYNLTRAEAIEIYRRDYWQPVIDRVTDRRMQIMVFDSAINHGVGRALSWYETYPDFNDYVTNRLRFYTGLNTWSDFGRGWTRRVAKIIEVANRIEAGEHLAHVMIDRRPWLDRILTAFAGMAWNVRYEVSRTPEGVELSVDTNIRS